MSLKEPFEVSMRKFREAVEGIEEESIRIKMQTGYLLAARNCEITTKVSEKELLDHRSRNYGIFMHLDFRDFTIQTTEALGIQLGLKEAFQQKVLVVRLAVAKRGMRVRTKDRENEILIEVTAEETEKALKSYKQTELLKKWKAGQVTIDPLLVKVLNGDVHLRYVALPCSTTDYEPWILDIIKWYQKHSTENLSFAITRRTFHRIYREALKDILPPIYPHGKGSMKNPLRHIRISHLLEYYGLNPYELNAYTGWSLAGIFSQLGQVVSSNLELYAHLSWRMYVPKLCVPMSKFIGTVQIAA